MFFNPLFLQLTNSETSSSQLKMQKMNGSSYLFSDIIKVCFDKSENIPDTKLFQPVNENSNNSLNEFVEKLFNDKFNLNELSSNPEMLISGDMETLLSNSPVHLNKKEVHKLIADLLNGSSDFKGKISLLLDETQLNGENETLEQSPESLINALKNGGTLLIEDPDQAKDNGLLITIVESNEEGSEQKEKDTKSPAITESTSLTEGDYGIKLSLINLTNKEFGITVPGTETNPVRKLNISLGNQTQEYFSSPGLSVDDIAVYARLEGIKSKSANKINSNNPLSSFDPTVKNDTTADNTANSKIFISNTGSIENIDATELQTSAETLPANNVTDNSEETGAQTLAEKIPASLNQDFASVKGQSEVQNIKDTVKKTSPGNQTKKYDNEILSTTVKVNENIQINSETNKVNSFKLSGESTNPVIYDSSETKSVNTATNAPEAIKPVDMNNVTGKLSDTKQPSKEIAEAQSSAAGETKTKISIENNTKTNPLKVNVHTDVKASSDENIKSVENNKIENQNVESTAKINNPFTETSKTDNIDTNAVSDKNMRSSEGVKSNTQKDETTSAKINKPIVDASKPVNIDPKFEADKKSAEAERIIDQNVESDSTKSKKPVIDSSKPVNVTNKVGSDSNMRVSETVKNPNQETAAGKPIRYTNEENKTISTVKQIKVDIKTNIDSSTENTFNTPKNPTATKTPTTDTPAKSEVKSENKNIENEETLRTADNEVQTNNKITGKEEDTKTNVKVNEPLKQTNTEKYIVEESLNDTRISEHKTDTVRNQQVKPEIRIDKQIITKTNIDIEKRVDEQEVKHDLPVHEKIKSVLDSEQINKPVSMKEMISRGLRELNSESSQIDSRKYDKTFINPAKPEIPKEGFAESINNKSDSRNDVVHKIDTENRSHQLNDKSLQKEDKNFSRNEKSDSGLIGHEKAAVKSNFSKELSETNPVSQNINKVVEGNPLSAQQKQETTVKEQKQSAEKSSTVETDNTANKKAHMDTIPKGESQVFSKDKLNNDILPQQTASKIIKAADIIKEMSKFIQEGNKNSIVLKLDPENLGSMKIQLEIVNKMVNAQIEVDNEITQKLVESHLPQLYNTLSQSGVQVNMLNISLNNFDQKNAKNLFHKKKTPGDESERIVDEKSTVQEKNLGYNTYEYLI